MLKKRSQSYPPIDKRQRAWLGHMLRDGDLLPIVIEGRVERRSPPGNPRTALLDRIKNGSSYQSIKRRAFRKETIRLDLPAGRTHTHTHTHTHQCKLSHGQTNQMQ